MDNKIIVVRHQNYNDFFTGRSLFVSENDTNISHKNIVFELDKKHEEDIKKEFNKLGFSEYIVKTKFGKFYYEDDEEEESSDSIQIVDPIDDFVESVRADQDEDDFFYTHYTTHHVYKSEKRGAFIDTFSYEKGKVLKIYITYHLKDHTFFNKKIGGLVDRYKYIKEKEDNEFAYFNVISYNNSFYLHERKIRTPIVEEYYYNDLGIERLIKSLGEHGSGIYIMSGSPGTGKTSLIKYIISKLKKKVCYLPTSLVSLFGDPSFQGFLDRLTDSVLIIEDCETLIKSRKNSLNYDISTLLNLGDGILGESLNIKTILTYNVSDDVDDAILRKGRCLFKHHFGELEPDVATKISKEIGNHKVYDKKVNLAEIFNPEDGDYSVKNTKIGFLK